MKATTKCYVPVSVDTELPKENGWYHVVENGYKETLYFDTDDNMFLSDGNKARVSSWLKPQELITFTKEEWSEQESKIEIMKGVIMGAASALPVLKNVLDKLGLKLGAETAKEMIETISKLNNL